MRVSQRLVSQICAGVFSLVAMTSGVGVLFPGAAICNSSIWLTTDGWQISCNGGSCSCIGSPYECAYMNGITIKKCGCFASIGGLQQGGDKCSAVILIDPLDQTETWECRDTTDDVCSCGAFMPTCGPVNGITEGQTLVAPTQACACK